MTDISPSQQRNFRFRVSFGQVSPPAADMIFGNACPDPGHAIIAGGTVRHRLAELRRRLHSSTSQGAESQSSGTGRPRHAVWRRQGPRGRRREVIRLLGRVQDEMLPRRALEVGDTAPPPPLILIVDELPCLARWLARGNASARHPQNDIPALLKMGRTAGVSVAAPGTADTPQVARDQVTAAVPPVPPWRRLAARIRRAHGGRGRTRGEQLAGGEHGPGSQ
jgi:hypothetical protein